MMHSWLSPLVLTAPFVPLLVKGARTRRPGPDLDAIDRVLESSPPARRRVVLSDEEERAVREATAWFARYDAVLDPPMRQTRQTLTQIVKRCQV